MIAPSRWKTITVLMALVFGILFFGLVKAVA